MLTRCMQKTCSSQVRSNFVSICEHTYLLTHGQHIVHQVSCGVNPSNVSCVFFLTPTSQVLLGGICFLIAQILLHILFLSPMQNKIKIKIKILKNQKSKIISCKSQSCFFFSFLFSQNFT